MLLPVDRHPHPRRGPFVERPLNCGDGSLEVGCRRGLAGPFSRRVPQLELSSRHNDDFDGCKQDEQ
jgi:hypothetical protein